MRWGAVLRRVGAESGRGEAGRGRRGRLLSSGLGGVPSDRGGQPRLLGVRRGGRVAGAGTGLGAGAGSGAGVGARGPKGCTPSPPPLPVGAWVGAVLAAVGFPIPALMPDTSSLVRRRASRSRSRICKGVINVQLSRLYRVRWSTYVGQLLVATFKPRTSANCWDVAVLFSPIELIHTSTAVMDRDNTPASLPSIASTSRCTTSDAGVLAVMGLAA